MLPRSRPIGAAVLLLACCGPAATVYAQSAAPDQPTSATTAAQVRDSAIQSLTGNTLLHSRHVEFVFEPLTIEIPRTVMPDGRLTFSRIRA